jgi:hypothetical protein
MSVSFPELMSVKCEIARTATGLEQVPAVQISFVHALLSLQSAPVVQQGPPPVNWQPVAALQISVVQLLLSLQTIAVLVQFPFAVLHPSTVHKLLSLQFFGA